MSVGCFVVCTCIKIQTSGCMFDPSCMVMKKYSTKNKMSAEVKDHHELTLAVFHRFYMVILGLCFLDRTAHFRQTALAK